MSIVNLIVEIFIYLRFVIYFSVKKLKKLIQRTNIIINFIYKIDMKMIFPVFLGMTHP